MSIYLTPILSGVAVSFVLFFLLSLPIAIFQYRKYNGVLRKKNLVLASFVLYMVVAWFLTLLPLPSRTAVANMAPVHHNKEPFLFVKTFLEKSGFDLNNKGTWLKALKSQYSYTVIFNVLLTFPFGVYMRKYFRKSFWATLLLGFLLAFFYELTQYTGLYGIYPQAYRVADVDDVMLNTLGVVIGFALTPLISKLLPTVEKGSLPIERQINVGLIRRFIAFITDQLLVSLFAFLLFIPFNLLGFSSEGYRGLVTALVYFSYYFMLVYFSQGKTLGCQLVKIKIISTRNIRLSFWQVLLRNGVLLFFTNLLPLFISFFSQPNPSTSQAFVTLGLIGLFFLFPLSMVGLRFFGKYRYIHELLSHTRLISESIHVSSNE